MLSRWRPTALGMTRCPSFPFPGSAAPHRLIVVFVFCFSSSSLFILLFRSVLPLILFPGPSGIHRRCWFPFHCLFLSKCQQSHYVRPNSHPAAAVYGPEARNVSCSSINGFQCHFSSRLLFQLRSSKEGQGLPAAQLLRSLRHQYHPIGPRRSPGSQSCHRGRWPVLQLRGHPEDRKDQRCVWCQEAACGPERHPQYPGCQ